MFIPTKKMQNSMLQSIKKYVNILIISIWGISIKAQSNIPQQAAALVQQHKYPETINFVSKNLGNIQDKADLYFFRGIAYFSTGDLDLAMNDFAIVNSLENHKADLWLARIYSLKNKEQETVSMLESFLNSKYRISESSIKKDTAFDPIQSSDAWFSLWQKDWQTPMEKLQAEIDYQVSKEKWFVALDLINNEIGVQPSNGELYFMRGKVYIQQGNFKGAVQDFNLAENNHYNNSTLYEERAKAYTKNENFSKAVEDYKKALRMDPYNFSLYVNIASVYGAMEQWEEATKYVEDYLGYFPGDPKAIGLCGDMYYQNGNYLNALKCYNLNLKNNPSNPNYYKSRGKAYLATNMDRYALNDFSMALDINPEDPELYINKGLALQKLGQKEKACSNWKKASQLGSKEAVEYLLKYCRED